MNQKEALAFVERHGIVLQAARGPLPNLAEAIAGGTIRGSWWGHSERKRDLSCGKGDWCESRRPRLQAGLRQDYIRASASLACIDQACLRIPQRTAGQAMGRAH